MRDKAQNLMNIRQRSTADHSKIFILLSTVLALCFGMLILLAFLTNLWSNQTLSVLSVFFALLSGGGIYCVYEKLQKQYFHKIVLLSGILVLLLCQIILARSIYSTENMWNDMARIIEGASELADHASFNDYNNTYYFSMYPNNVFLLVLFKNIFQVGQILGVENFFVLAIGFNLLMVDVAAILTFLCAYKMMGKKGTVLTGFFLIPLVCFSPYIVYPYSDTLSLFCPVLIFYCYLQLHNKSVNNYVLVAIIAITAVIGISIKPQNMIVLISIIFVELFGRKINRRRMIDFCKFGMCLVLIMGLSFIGISYYKESQLNGAIPPKMQEELEVPFTHYLMLGLNPDTYGTFSPEDSRNTMQYQGKREKQAYHFSVIQQRLQAYGFKGYLNHLYHKICIIFSSGVFGGISGAGRPAVHNGPLSKALQGVFYLNGEGHLFLSQIFQGLWLVVLLFLFLPIFCGYKSTQDHVIAAMRLSIVGLTIFLFLFEAGPRYLFHLAPVFILLSVHGMLCGPYKIKFTKLMRSF